MDMNNVNLIIPFKVGFEVFLNSNIEVVTNTLIIDISNPPQNLWEKVRMP